jgi:hypothetical protein
MGLEMDGIDLLRQQALVRRNAAIQAAKREYHTALKEKRPGAEAPH